MRAEAHPRPWHRNSAFGPGPRRPLDRERRVVWKARIEMHRRAVASPMATSNLTEEPRTQSSLMQHVSAKDIEGARQTLVSRCVVSSRQDCL